jgi:hypothetical protein
MLSQQLSSVVSVKQPSSTVVLAIELATEEAKIAKIKPARMAANWRETDPDKFGNLWTGA